jgi:hypothetical protein
VTTLVDAWPLPACWPLGDGWRSEPPIFVFTFGVYPTPTRGLPVHCNAAQQTPLSPPCNPTSLLFLPQYVHFET